MATDCLSDTRDPELVKFESDLQRDVAKARVQIIQDRHDGFIVTEDHSYRHMYGWLGYQPLVEIELRSDEEESEREP